MGVAGLGLGPGLGWGLALRAPWSSCASSTGGAEEGGAKASIRKASAWARARASEHMCAGQSPR